jgi:hypothetical protein
MIKLERGFNPSDRYKYDRELNYRNGWAQVDTKQDASYYGTWTSPKERKIFTYCEGDTCLTECDTDQEYVEEMNKLVVWQRDAGYWKGIDAGFGPEMRERFKALGLEGLLH